jgi:hypothetical protein
LPDAGPLGSLLAMVGCGVFLGILVPAYFASAQIGVDPQILARGQRPGHWGLPGMRERSERFGGHLHVWSEGNAGTAVELRIPAHVAYAQPPASLSSGLGGFLAAVVQGKLRRIT